MFEFTKVCRNLTLKIGEYDKLCSYRIKKAKGTFEYHNLQHNYSFRLINCKQKIIKIVHDPAKFSKLGVKIDGQYINICWKVYEDKFAKILALLWDSVNRTELIKTTCQKL